MAELNCGGMAVRPNAHNAMVRVGVALLVIAFASILICYVYKANQIAYITKYLKGGGSNKLLRVQISGRGREVICTGESLQNMDRILSAGGERAGAGFVRTGYRIDLEFEDGVLMTCDFGAAINRESIVLFVPSDPLELKDFVAFGASTADKTTRIDEMLNFLLDDEERQNAALEAASRTFD